MEANGTLTLTEEDVTGGKVFEILNKVRTINRDGKSAVKVKNLVLPFKPELYEDEWKGTSLNADNDPTFRLRDALAILLGQKDFDFETLTLTSKEGLDLNAFEKALNETLKARNINRLVSVSHKGVITFKKHMPMPEFKSENDVIITSYNEEENKNVTQSMLTLKWTNDWTEWFEDPTTDFGEFIEALTEHPEIRCVDFSYMNKDSDGHKKYLTENAVKQLLKVNDVYFVCRYMPKDREGSLSRWKTWGESYNLSFVRCENNKIAMWYWHGDEKNKVGDNKGGWLDVYSQGRYVVAKKTENGKKRLLWNKAALEDVLACARKKDVLGMRDALSAFSGRGERKQANRDYKNLPDKDNKAAKSLVPYEPIDVIDFTIGDSKGEFKIGNNKYNWANVHKSISVLLMALNYKDDFELSVQTDLEAELQRDEDEKDLSKRLTDAKRAELEEQLHIVKQLRFDGLKSRIQYWNKENPNLQLNENASFMEQWRFIRGNKNPEEDKLSLISELGLEKPSIRMLRYPALLERMFQWKVEMREAFMKQWNEARKKDKNTKANNTQPLLTEKDAKTQEQQIRNNWDLNFRKELTQQLRLVELLSLLEESTEAKKAFINKWNEEYETCKYTLGENLKPVAQVARIVNWKQCTHENHKLSKTKDYVRNRLSRFDYLKNFMPQWSKEDQKEFIDEWNKNHKEDKLIAGKDPFEQFVNILNRGIGKKLEDAIRYTESSKRLNAILEKRNKEKANVMRFLQNIGGVSILAYKDCIPTGEDLPMKARGLFIKSYQKGDRNIVEIKYDFHYLRSRFEWNEEEVKDVFNPIREKDEDKKKEQEQAFIVASDVFEAPAGRFAPKKTT